MKLCTFQGTFNPIHNAHIRAAEFAIDNFGFDKILFIPAYNPPHKSCSTSMAQHRFNMVKLALEKYPGFEVSDIEYKRKGTSYTYLTVCELYKEYDIDGKLNFLIGTDAFEKLQTWYEFDKLKTLVKFIVFIREDKFEISKYNYLKDLGVDFDFQKLPFLDISSTELREKIKNNKNISGLLPQKVEEYIKKNELYKN